MIKDAGIQIQSNVLSYEKQQYNFDILQDLGTCEKKPSSKAGDLAFSLCMTAK